MSNCKVCDILKQKLSKGQMSKDEYRRQMVRHNDEQLEYLRQLTNEKAEAARK